MTSTTAPDDATAAIPAGNPDLHDPRSLTAECRIHSRPSVKVMLRKMVGTVSWPSPERLTVCRTATLSTAKPPCLREIDPAHPLLSKRAVQVGGWSTPPAEKPRTF